MNQPLIQLLKGLGRTKTYEKGALILCEQDDADQLFLIEAGIVRIFKTGLNGKEVEINRVKEGQFFGEAFLLAGVPYMVSVQAEKQSKILLYDRESVFDAIKKKPELALEMIKILAQRCIRLNQSLEDVSVEDLPIRLVKYILRNIDVDGEDEQLFELPISKKGLASKLGTIPETLSRVFDKLDKQGLIKVEGKTIVVLSVNELSQYL